MAGNPVWHRNEHYLSPCKAFSKYIETRDEYLLFLTFVYFTQAWDCSSCWRRIVHRTFVNDANFFMLSGGYCLRRICINFWVRYVSVIDGTADIGCYNSFFRSGTFLFVRCALYLCSSITASRPNKVLWGTKKGWCNQCYTQFFWCLPCPALFVCWRSYVYQMRSFVLVFSIFSFNV